MVGLKRIYDGVRKEDGCRILVDGLWPRGQSKEKAAVDLWEKETAPTQELREWFGHRPERFDEFRERYLAELRGNPAAGLFAEMVRKQLSRGAVTFVYAARDPVHNHAMVLKQYVEERLKEGKI